jgi:hypothetical protein
LTARITLIAADFYAHIDDARAYPRTTGAETTEAFVLKPWDAAADPVAFAAADRPPIG